MSNDITDAIIEEMIEEEIESIIEDEIDDFEEMEEDEEETVVKNTDEKENSFEWYTGRKTMTVTVSQRKFVNKVMKFAELYPDEVQIQKINKDGTILAHIPLNYLKLSRPREISEEQRENMRQRAYQRMEEGKSFFKKKTE